MPLTTRLLTESANPNGTSPSVLAIIPAIAAEPGSRSVDAVETS